MRDVPAKDYAGDFDPPEAVTCEVIGWVRSPYVERFGTPRQATTRHEPVDARIELRSGLGFEQATRDLGGFDYVWVVAWMHLNRGWSPTVQPPRGPKRRRGLLATRAPHRPNPLGLSALRLVRVEGRVLHVRGIDLLDGTPVLDIKPYVPYADAFPDARSGWLDELDQPPDAPDRPRPSPSPSTPHGSSS